MTEEQGIRTERFPESNERPDSGSASASPASEPAPAEAHVTGFYSAAGDRPDRVTEGTLLLQAPEPLFAWLVEPSAAAGAQLHRLSAGKTTIGRDPANELVLQDESVSARHASVTVGYNDQDGTRLFVLHDEDSANGTRVNGALIQVQALNNNDEITVGRTVLIFKRL